ncbi:unnamed protein product [Adineta steineri]|uniref:Uncharacterized protein n=1 Tax=Adineta steineri TaxID=433720 RepID=A0A814K6V8_9BILA|nr:unnamed protein product [Adineta steineri]
MELELIDFPIVSLFFFFTRKGDYQKNKRHGRGIFYYTDGSKYDGEWNENIRDGHGIYTYPNNDTYEGEWKNHQRHGKGTYTYASTKAQYIGTWKEGKRQGPGELEFNQYKYIGKFHDNYVSYFPSDNRNFYDY